MKKVERMSGNNLHTFSKVLEMGEPFRKRVMSKCQKLQWESPYFLNVTKTLIKEMDPIETNMI